MSQESRQQSYSPPLGVSVISALIALSALVSLLFAGHYLLRGTVQGKGTHALVLAGVLLGVAALEGVVALGLRRLKPWAWYAGVGLFGAAAAVSLYVFVLKLSLLAMGYLVLNVLTAGYIYHKRPIYTPGTQARYDAYHGESVLAKFEMVREMRESDAAPLGVKAVAVVGAFASLIAFAQGVRLIWMSNGAATVLGLLVVVTVALQAYTLYGLWIVERWAWFAGLALFALATLFATFRVLLMPTPLATVEFLVNGLITLYLYRQKPLYAPRVTVDLTPR